MPDIAWASAGGDEMHPHTASSGLNLWLELEDPNRMQELQWSLADNSTGIPQALRPLPD